MFGFSMFLATETLKNSNSVSWSKIKTLPQYVFYSNHHNALWTGSVRESTYASSDVYTLFCKEAD